MIKNLRSKPIIGHVTDNSGNIVLNTEVLIKQLTANDNSILVATAKTNLDGKFETGPIKNGVYSIEESGIVIDESYYHNPNPTSIQTYQLDSVNELSVNGNGINIEEPNKSKFYIQLENDGMNVDIIDNLGHIYPLYEVDPLLISDDDPFYNISSIHNAMTSSSRITHTRFDVEYYNDSGKRIRWAGIPAIMFKEKLVLPLDNYSIVPSDKTSYSINADIPSDSTGWSMIVGSGDKGIHIKTNTENLNVGDILKISFDTIVFWCIIVNKGVDAINATKWFSSNAYDNIDDLSSAYGNITSIDQFPAMFSTMLNIKDSTNNVFSVNENTYAQNQFNPSEVYNYNEI